MSELNTIYIMSKGRPHCITAHTLIDLDYKGEWFICCGNNDDRLEEYFENWGDKVLVYDWYTLAEQTNTLDNFSNEKINTGVPTAREGIRQISESRGDKRFWCFDDDLLAFYIKHPITRRKLKMDGYMLEKYLNILTEFAHRCGLNNCGFQIQQNGFPSATFQTFARTYVIHNFPTDKSKFVEWKGRTCDDVINILETFKYGFYQLSFGFMNFSTNLTLTEEGGCTGIYKKIDEFRLSDYVLLIEPKWKLIPKKRSLMLSFEYSKSTPKLISEKWKRVR